MYCPLLYADRNCHKSIEQGLIISGATPVYLRPSRNRFGIIGPIYDDHLGAEAVADAVADSPLASRLHAAGGRPVYAVVTNCTYDGLCYDAQRVQALLQATASLEFVHFDEAWFGYARFHPVRYIPPPSQPRPAGAGKRSRRDAPVGV